MGLQASFRGQNTKLEATQEESSKTPSPITETSRDYIHLQFKCKLKYSKTIFKLYIKLVLEGQGKLPML